MYEIYWVKNRNLRNRYRSFLPDLIIKDISKEIELDVEFGGNTNDD